MSSNLQGFERRDGRKGIRNTLQIIYLVECARHVATKISQAVNQKDVQVLGFPGCYPNEYALDLMSKLGTHPNVGAVLLISLGCEGFNRFELERRISESGRPVLNLVIQKEGGTLSTIKQGSDWAKTEFEKLGRMKTVPMSLAELSVGTICGGSDGTSGITANPAIGRAFDQLVDAGATCIFEETGELIGCEHHMASRAASPEVKDKIYSAIEKAARYYSVLGHGSFAPGNADGGLTTQEEKSMGAYCKSGDRIISDVIIPGEIPKNGGLYLMDVVPDGEVRFGFPNIADSAEIIELIASGCQVITFATGRGSVVGSVISPVIKICANPDTYKNMADDMDLNAGAILTGEFSLDEVGQQLFAMILAVSAGQETKSEAMGHQEQLITYKYFDGNKTNC